MKRYFNSIEEACKHGKPFSDLYKCSKCLVYWWLMDSLYCPKCGGTHTGEEVEIPGIEYVKY